MITVLNGKLTIPQHLRFIGFAGDNLVRTIRFLLYGQKEADRIYRLYLTFDDGTVNYFVLPSEVTDEGVVLTWEVQQQHIFKSGNVKVQIKAFRNNGVVYHTTRDTFIVGNSAEFSDSIKNSNTEFLQYEEKLNSIAEFIGQATLLSPYIGDNGNWYVYDSNAGGYVDSKKPSRGEASAGDIASGAITSDKLALGAIDREELFSDSIRKSFLSMPVNSISVAGDVQEDFYNSLTEPGIYQIDSYSGIHQVLIVMKPAADVYLMQILLEYDKIMYRGIFCSEDGEYADEEWRPWQNISKSDVIKPEEYFEVSSLGRNADPQILSYQTADPTTKNEIRIPLSVIKRNILFIEDNEGYFESNNVEGALRELGAELDGVALLLSRL